MATTLLVTRSHPNTNELESKLQRLLMEGLCGVDTVAMVLAAAGDPIEGGYDGPGESEEAMEHDAVERGES